MYSYLYRKLYKKIFLFSSIAIIILMAMFVPQITGRFFSEKESSKILVNNSEIVNQQEVCNNVEETYTELEPYNVKQCILIPTAEKQCEIKNMSYSLDKECYWSGNLNTLNAKCTVKNLDENIGIFVIEIGIINKTNQKIGEQKNITIYPQSSADLTFSYNIDIGNCYCNEISIPTKEICDDKIIDKEHCFEFTSYKPVTKTRTVEKCD